MNPLTGMSADTASLSSGRSSVDERPEVSFSYLEDWSGNVKALIDQLEHGLHQFQSDQEDVTRSAVQLQKAYEQVRKQPYGTPSSGCQAHSYLLTPCSCRNVPS
jgi:hypothetical protein